MYYCGFTIKRNDPRQRSLGTLGVFVEVIPLPNSRKTRSRWVAAPLCWKPKERCGRLLIAILVAQPITRRFYLHDVLFRMKRPNWHIGVFHDWICTRSAERNQWELHGGMYVFILDTITCIDLMNNLLYCWWCEICFHGNTLGIFKWGVSHKPRTQTFGMEQAGSNLAIPPVLFISKMHEN